METASATETYTQRPLGRRAIDLLIQLFCETSNLNLPVGVASQVMEIREWASGQARRMDAEAAAKKRSVRADRGKAKPA